MKTEALEYEADGSRMVGHLAIGEDGPGRRPGILVFPEAFGVDEHAKSRAERLAGEFGYTALACDVHGEGYVASDLGEALRLLEPVRKNPAKIRAIGGGALKALSQCVEVDTGRIGAIGFCFGGTMALELARGGANVAAVVGFHSGLATSQPEDAKAIKGKVLVCIGADDPSIPPEQRVGFEREMRQGGVKWAMSIYGGVVHSFTNKEVDKLARPESSRYDAVADARSWAEMGFLFKEVFG
jgi:dienelactone hydrolase